ncbi:hypothetical protein M0811_00712 [Anaeramoeba ignava]|uniref:Uncharacterized protein n=1 Tax=Anaeramoeba ignava TaxID=1746090 RepID=A0A9Q0RCV1_ANAIG|nr:hypothetical protein M0811_00712 [Anaeramoeba ignava]
MVSSLEIVKRTARAASGTGSPQLYIIGIISAIVALLVLYEIIRTIRLTRSIWKNITSRFRILILSSCFLELFLTSIFFLISFNWKSIFSIIFFYITFPVWLQFCTFTFYILYLAKTLYMIEGKETKLKKYLDLIFGILIGFNFIFVILLDYFNSKILEKGKSNLGADILATLYIVFLMVPLVVLFTIMGVKYFKKSKEYVLVKIQKERIKYTIILIIIDDLIFTVFLVSTLFGAFGANKITSTVNGYLEDEEYSKYDTSILLITLIFVMIPAFVLFLILHRVLSIEKRMFQREENILLTDSFDYYSNVDPINSFNFDLKFN